MSIRLLRPELQKIAEEELNEVANRIEDDLEHLREWLKKQPHLNARTEDQWLIGFLRGCKFSLQRTKEKLDYFYTLKTLIPEFFADRDPFAPDIQEMLNAGVFLPLPNITDVMCPMIILLRWDVCNPDRVSIPALVKTYFMLMDILMYEDDNCVVSGLIIWEEMSGFNLSYILDLTPSYLKKFMLCVLKAYPLRLKGLHCTNGPAAFETIINILKSFLGNKIKERISLFRESNFEKIYSYVPKKVMPKEFGGDNESVDVLTVQWKKKFESYKEWFMEDAKYCTNEALRDDSPKTISDVFGIEGTFRKLDID